ncbi:MAG: pilus assembly protein PilM, partial [Gammaproteobacteria bacterium]
MNKISNNSSQLKKFLELFGIFTDPIIGIDIGSSSVKVMEIAQIENKYLIKNFAVEKLNVGDVVEKNIKNKEAVIQALNKALAKTKISSHLGCISIPNSVAISKIIKLENGFDVEELLNAIVF